MLFHGTMQKNLNKFGTDKILKDNQKLGLILSDTQHLTQFKDFQGASNRSDKY